MDLIDLDNAGNIDDIMSRDEQEALSTYYYQLGNYLAVTPGLKRQLWENATYGLLMYRVKNTHKEPLKRLSYEDIQAFYGHVELGD